MGCLNDKPQSFNRVSDNVSNDSQELLTPDDDKVKYDFVAEYNTKIDLNVNYKETVSRRPSVSISIANIDILLNQHKDKQEKAKRSNDDDKTSMLENIGEEKDEELKNDNNHINISDIADISDKNVFIKKYFKSDQWNNLSFRREAKILSTISHNNIIKYITSYQDDIAYFLVIEYCNNGSLISYINNKYLNKTNHKDQQKRPHKYDEIIIYDIIKSLISAISYIHKLNIVHRNLCLENIMIGNDGKYKIINWDDAEIIDDKNTVYDDFVGQSIYYLPPEAYNIRHGWELKKIDIFSIGVITFILSFGSVPFTGIHQTNIVRKIRNNKTNWPKNNKWNEYISMRLKKLIQSMLSPYPYSRISAHDALLMPFLKQNKEDVLKQDKITKILINTVPFKLNCYESSMKIRKLLIEHDCNEWTKYEQNELIKVFKQIFNLQKEKINILDLQNLLIKMGLNKRESERKTKQLFQIMDPKESGTIVINNKNIKNNKNNGNYSQRIYSSSHGKEFQYSPIGQQMNYNDDQMELMMVDDDDNNNDDQDNSKSVSELQS